MRLPGLRWLTSKAWLRRRRGGGGRGVIVSDASPAIEARLKEFQDGMLAGLAKRTMKQRGIDDPTPVIDEYPALARK